MHVETVFCRLFCINCARGEDGNQNCSSGFQLFHFFSLAHPGREILNNRKLNFKLRKKTVSFHD